MSITQFIAVAIIVIRIFINMIIQHIPAGNKREIPSFPEVAILGSHCVIPLILVRKYAQEVLLLIGLIPIGIEGELIVGTQTYKGQVVLIVELVYAFELAIDIER